MKKLQALVVLTKPLISSIKASSAPAFSAAMQARIQFNFEWLFNLGSCVIGRPRICGTVASRIGLGILGRECSIIIVMVGPDFDKDGCWKGRIFTPRVIINRAWASVLILLACCVSNKADTRFPLVRPISKSMALAASNNLSKWSSMKAQHPSYRRSPSQIPSPSIKPLS